MHGIKKFGKEGFSRLLNRSRSRFDFKFSNILAGNDITTADGRIKAASEAAEMIAQFRSEVERDVYIRQVCAKLDVPYDGMKNDIARRIAKRDKKDRKEQNLSVIRAAEGFGDRVNPDRLKNVGAAGAEDAIIGILAMFPELIPEASEGKLKLTPDDFVTAFNRRVYEKMTELGSEFDVGLIADTFTPDEIARIVKNMVSRQNLTENGITVIAQCADKLRKNKEKELLSLEDLIASKRKKG